jgi:pyruvate,water dikinase
LIGKLGELSGLSKNHLGGKAYSLNLLCENGFAVPKGIAIPSSYFMDCLMENKVIDEVLSCCKSVGFANISPISKRVQTLVLGCVTKKSFACEIEDQIRDLGEFVSVRSSAASEDGELHTFAGLHDSFLNVQCVAESVTGAIKKCWASLFNERALLYRIKKKLPIFEGMAVVIQQMVQAKCSGVVYTRHPIESEFILVESAFGIGDSVVDGVIKPDSFLVSRNPLKISKKEIGSKKTRTDVVGGEHYVSKNEHQDVFSINDEVVMELVSECLKIEQLFGKTQDIEWAYDNSLWVLQSRTVAF